MKTIYETPKNYIKKIESIYAFLSVDEFGEGVMGATLPNGVFMPLVGADIERINSLKPIVLEAVKDTKKTVRLVKFTTREELEIIEP
jgi:hypothetical protein